MAPRQKAGARDAEENRGGGGPQKKSVPPHDGAGALAVKVGPHAGCCEACMSAIDPAAMILPFPKTPAIRSQSRIKTVEIVSYHENGQAQSPLEGPGPVHRSRRRQSDRGPRSAHPERPVRDRSASARASATRLIGSPPESSEGKRSATSGLQSDHAEVAAAGDLIEQPLARRRDIRAPGTGCF